MNDLFIALSNANYATFLTQLKASGQLMDIHSTDTNNGTFRTSLGKFRYVYNPTGGSGNTGEIAFHVLETTSIPFTTDAQLQTYLTTVTAIL